MQNREGHDLNSRRLTPDRVYDLDFYELPGMKEEFHDSWKDLQDRSASHDIIWTTSNGGHWIATRANSIQTVLSDFSKFSSYRMVIPRGTDRSHRWHMLPIALDPPEHGPFRKVLNAGLSAKAITQRKAQIDDLAIGLIEGLQPRGSCEFVSDFAEQFPVQMLFIIMDLPQSARDHMMTVITQANQPTEQTDWPTIIGAFADFLGPFVRERMGSDGSDLISQLCAGVVNDRPITADEVLEMCMQTVAAGLESVRNALSFIMLRLARDPDLRCQLANDPDLISPAAQEFLRRYSAMVPARQVVEDVEFDGVTLLKDDLIACPVHLVGLDERVNRCPMDFDIARKAAVVAPFGVGAHFCPGRSLADYEIKLAIREWLRRIPEFEVAPNARITFTGGLLGSVDMLPLIW